ncbi:Phosphatidylinositol-4-phosphate 5-Kinase [Musa troglodytarum]|uniref:1-phosphatidylinositol-3-phosphate 5-kinase n=1 Tax=Musa troglodytarum TaxID=320322 RepID=A0A9E7KQY3_9LILI|nr:Phosphatidylinositol-4-phosphate 5-Kinase [Musa troglodytarum]
MSIESDEYNVPIISCKTGNISEHHQPEHRGSCLEKYDQEVLTMNDFSPYATPPLSPMSSYASCSSSFGDIWTGLNLQGREDGCGVIDTGEKQRGKSIESSLARTCADGSGHHILTGKNLSSSSLDSNEEENKLVNHILDDVQAKNVGLDSFKVEDLVDNDSPTMLPNFETDPGIWEPPEPECMEDDQPSIADNYEDDEYSSTDWKQPSSLSILDEHQGINHSFREKRQKAMLEEMNRQFKVLVSRFLASEGISFSGLDDGQSWLGIVASLSWKAALLVKPDATEGRAMDPGSYVKVKCVASGSRHQSELIKGLVFKKHAAHKHMPTKFKNPKLLLLQGALGHSAVGLSSFDSMGQEKDYLRSLAEMIEACNPNVVLVEKNISRDIQESLTEKGITVILLKGAPSDELKKIKQVVQYTVFAAYNLILETSFVADQRLLVSDKNAKSCSSCGKPPEAHMYTYTHQNGNLSVHVRKLPPVLHLPGEAEGKIWMWTRCLRCKDGSGISTRRVVLSSSARYLSFGKFLELSFSCQSVARLSECGHMLHRDFLRFFGIGSKVAVFVYSSVKIYAACKPPPVLDFDNPKRQEWLRTEMQILLHQGRRLFSEVSNLLQNLKPIYSGTLAKQCAEVSGSFKNLSEVEEMLIQEKAEFEAPLLKAVDHSGQMEITPHEILGLKWLYQELLFELYVWDCRLGRLLQHILVHDDEVPKLPSHEDEPPRFTGSHHAQDMHINLDIESTEASIVTSHSSYKLLDIGPVEVEQSTDLPSPSEGKQSCQVVCVPISGDLQFDHSIQIVEEPYIEKKTDVELKNDEKVAGGEMLAASLSNEHSNILDDIYAKSEGPEEMIWASFSDLKREYRRDLHSGSLHKFEFINSYSPSHLSPIYQPSSGEMDLLHYTVGPNGNIVSASKDEISSIIACGLAILEDQHGLLDMVVKESGEIHKSYSLTSVNSEICTYWSSVGYSESGISLSHGGSSLSFDESSTSISDGSLSVNQLLPSENLHPEVTVGIEKVQQNIGGKEIKTDLMVMENLLYGHKISRTYDLKGTVFSRYIPDAKYGGKVLLDQNFVEDMDKSPIYVSGKTKHLLQRAIWNDTSFLTSINVMDYSLLVGVDDERQELVFGIIDYLRQYTWDKQLETWVKASMVVPRNELPTVISPKEYKKRCWRVRRIPLLGAAGSIIQLIRASGDLTMMTIELVWFGDDIFHRVVEQDQCKYCADEPDITVQGDQISLFFFQPAFADGCFWLDFWIPFRADDVTSDPCFRFLLLFSGVESPAATLVAYALMEYLGTRPCTTAFGESIYCRKLDHRAMQPLEETSRIA